jgi:mono/diheme cytochrome c family protein
MWRPALLASFVILVTACMSGGGGTSGPQVPGDAGDESVTAAIEAGALAYEDWTTAAAGGTGVLPAGETEKAYVTCVSCHGWDLLGKDGGSARKARTAAEPNAGYGDTLNTATRRLHYLAAADYAASDIWHLGSGRGFDQGSAAWDGGSAAGIARGNEHPDYSLAGGLSQTQIDDLVAFLNSTTARADRVFSIIEPRTDPMLYRTIDGASATRGQSFYQVNCASCHGSPDADSTALTNNRPGVGGFVALLQIDGAYSRFAFRTRWGAPGTAMTRAAIGNPTAVDVADVIAYLNSLLPVPVGDVGRGLQLLTENACLGCHASLGNPSPDRVTNYMGTVDGQMDHLIFNDQQVADLKAYLQTIY